MRPIDDVECHLRWAILRTLALVSKDLTSFLNMSRALGSSNRRESWPCRFTTLQKFFLGGEHVRVDNVLDRFVRSALHHEASFFTAAQ